MDFRCQPTALFFLCGNQPAAEPQLPVVRELQLLSIGANVQGEEAYRDSDEQCSRPHPFGTLPEGRGTEQHFTAGWKITFFESPALQGSPIKDVGICTAHNRH